MNKVNWGYCDLSWNPIAKRCTPVSEGCDHCWHLTMADRLAKNPKLSPEVRAAYAGEGMAVLKYSRLEQPLKRKKPSVVAVQFMGDLWHESASFGMPDEVFEIMHIAQQHTFLVLTKRPESALQWYVDSVHNGYGAAPDYPLDNVHLGVTVENQRAADERIPILLQIPAAGHWVSLEPMLSAMDISAALNGYPELSGGGWAPGQEWDELAYEEPEWQQTVPSLSGVVLGGESGPGARPMYPGWARDVRDQCRAAGVSFHFKSWGEYAPCYEVDEGWWCLSETAGNIIAARIPNSTKILENQWDETCVAKVGAKRAGRLLDGREHNETAWGVAE